MKNYSIFLDSSKFTKFSNYLHYTRQNNIFTRKILVKSLHLCFIIVINGPHETRILHNDWIPPDGRQLARDDRSISRGKRAKIRIQRDIRRRLLSILGRLSTPRCVSSTRFPSLNRNSPWEYGDMYRCISSPFSFPPNQPWFHLASGNCRLLVVEGGPYEWNTTSFSSDLTVDQ